MRCTPQVHGAARDTAANAVAVGGYRAALGDRQPDRAARRPRRVVWALPRRPGGAALRLPRDRRRRGRFDRRTTDRSTARPHALARPAAVPRRGRRGQLRADDRAVHPSGDGRREPSSRRAGERRLDPDVGDAGGSRVDGVGRRPQAAPGGRQPRAHPRLRARLRRRVASTCALRCGRRPARPRLSPPCGRPESPVTVPIAGSRPSWQSPSSW